MACGALHPNGRSRCGLIRGHTGSHQTYWIDRLVEWPVTDN